MATFTTAAAVKHIMALNNHSLVLLETGKATNTRMALSYLKSALELAAETNGRLEASATTTTNSGVLLLAPLMLGDVCRACNIPIASNNNGKEEDDDDGPYFHNVGYYFQPTAFEQVLEASCGEGSLAMFQLTVTVVIMNMALGCYQFRKMNFHNTKRGQDLLQKCLNLYSQVCDLQTSMVMEMEHQNNDILMMNGALLFLSLAARNNVAWICLQLGYAEATKQAYELLLHSIRVDEAAIALVLSVEDQATVNEFAMNSNILALTGYFSHLAAGAA